MPSMHPGACCTFSEALLPSSVSSSGPLLLVRADDHRGSQAAQPRYSLRHRAVTVSFQGHSKSCRDLVWHDWLPSLAERASGVRKTESLGAKCKLTRRFRLPPLCAACEVHLQPRDGPEEEPGACERLRPSGDQSTTWRIFGTARHPRRARQRRTTNDSMKSSIRLAKAWEGLVSLA